MKFELNINTLSNKDSLNTGLYPVIIYQLIRQYSNENNKLEVKDIKETLAEYWQGDKEKTSSSKNIGRTLRRNMRTLLYFDSNIHTEDKDGNPIFIDFATSDEIIGKIKRVWYEQELSPTDIQLLSDAVIYSKHLSNERRIDLIKKLMHASGQPVSSNSEWFNNVLKDADDISIPVPGDLYYKLEYVNDAIQNRECLSFDYTFAGPNNAKYKVRSYKGVSPYRVIHNNGVYYLIGARNPSEKRDTLFSEYEKSTPIIIIEVHKLDKIKKAPELDYLEIQNTIGDKKTLQEIISAGYHPLTHEVIPFKFKEDIILKVNSRGLDVLIDHFGNRMQISKSSDIDSSYAGLTSELSYTYDVTIRNVANNDWYYELVPLLLQYPDTDIKLVESQNLLRIIMFKMRNRLNRLGEEFVIKNLNSPPKPVAKPPYNK